LTELSGISSWIADFDYSILDWLHNHGESYFVPFLQFISSSSTILSITVTVLLIVLSFLMKDISLRKNFYVLATVLILVVITSQGLKSVIIRDRPFEKYPGIEKLSDAGGSSFPSGHTMEAFAVATALSLLFRKKAIVIPFFAWACLVAYSRMALGVHYPSDVIAGMIIGSFIGWLVPRGFRKISPE
jgi:membrane-associated phospholipid phosphatase